MATRPTEDDKEHYESALKQCGCVERMGCHFCPDKLEEEPVGDEYAWCDWVLDTGDERYHILAHAYCAEGQIGVTRA
jgi:hypothetical protein